MSNIFREFLISFGFAVDAGSAAKAETQIKRVEEAAGASDKRTTKAQLREALIRGTTEAKSFGDRVRYAEKLEEIDKRFGGLALRRTLRQAAKHAETDEDRIKWLTRLRKAEEEHHQRSVAGLQSVATMAVGATVAIQGAALAFVGFASQVAAKLETMAYASERTRASVKDLRAFSQATEQLGGTAAGALNVVENLAERLRRNPQGYTAFLKSVGVEAKDANGNIRSALDLVKEFRKNVGATKPYEQQLLYAEEIGYDEQTYRAHDPEKLAAKEAEIKARQDSLNFDPDAAKEDAKQLQNIFRDMWDSISIVGEKAASKIFADVGGNIKSFTTFVEQHGDQIAEILSKVAQIVLAVSRAFLELATSDRVKSFLDGVLNTFGKVDDATGKWVADTEKIKELLEALAVFVAGVFVKKITDAFKDVIKEAKPLLTLLAPLLAGLGIGGSIGASVAIGTAVGADAAVPNAQKPGVTNHWDDEASGAAGGAGMGGALKRAWQWGKNAVGLGGKDAPGANHTGTNAEVTRQAAKELGISPKDLAAAISYETGGTFSPSKRGGAGNRHIGLIQFGPAEQEKYGANQGQTYSEQMGAVVRYLKDRGLKPGMDLRDIYSTINAGRPGRYGASDGFGTVQSHSEKIAREHGGRAEQFLNSGAATLKEVVGGFHPLDGQGRLTSDISAARVNPVTGQTRPHKGIDLAAPAGTDVKAMQSGLVKLGSHGDVTVTNPDGSSQTYRHVVPSVEDGARVAAGTIIAQLKANDPRSTGPHLHFEARDKAGNLQDPKDLLAPREPSTAPASHALTDQARETVGRINDAMGRLDTTKLKAFGEATQGFDPGKFFVAPPVGTEGATNNSSVKHQTFNGGTTNITQHVAGGADEGAAVFRRHKERQNADDVRYASSMFA